MSASPMGVSARSQGTLAASTATSELVAAAVVVVVLPASVVAASIPVFTAHGKLIVTNFASCRAN